MKSILLIKTIGLVLIATIAFSCTDNGISGVYQVYSADEETEYGKVYIEEMTHNEYKVSTSDSWYGVGEFKNDVLTVKWEYPKDYNDKENAGKKGIHKAVFDTKSNKFNVTLLSRTGVAMGKLIWKKINNLTINHVDKKTIYLTFDDGPFNGTKNILIALEDQDIKASFFIVGEHVHKNEKYNETFQLIIDSKHTVGNHSYSHASNNYNLYYKHPDAVTEDFEKNKTEVFDEVSDKNVDGTFLRFPGRNVWKHGKQIYNKWYNNDALPSVQILDDEYKVFGWDVEWDRYGNNKIKNPIVVVREINQKFKENKVYFNNKCVVLMHDAMFYTRENREKLIQFISELKDEGYEFETLENF